MLDDIIRVEYLDENDFEDEKIQTIIEKVEYINNPAMISFGDEKFYIDKIDELNEVIYLIVRFDDMSLVRAQVDNNGKVDCIFDDENIFLFEGTDTTKSVTMIDTKTRRNQSLYSTSNEEGKTNALYFADFINDKYYSVSKYDLSHQTIKIMLSFLMNNMKHPDIIFCSIPMFKNSKFNLYMKNIYKLYTNSYIRVGFSLESLLPSELKSKLDSYGLKTGIPKELITNYLKSDQLTKDYSEIIGCYEYTDKKNKTRELK